MKLCPVCTTQNQDAAATCENPDCQYGFNSSMNSQKTELFEKQQVFFSDGSFIAERYEIVRELGRGGMGVVYLVKDSKLRGREVALKMTHPELVSHGEARQRFEDEVILCLDLLHPNIVRVNNLDEWNNCLYFTMEYIPGKSLRQVIDERKEKTSPFFTLQETIQVINPVLEALSYAHQTTIHRDIKPENILIQGDFPDIKIKVLDFGIAKVLSASRFTRTAQSMGTAYYMSPEQMQGAKHVDHRADLYSVGMILYEMLTGKIAAGRFKLPGELIKGIPEQVDLVVEKILSPEPEDRFDNASEIFNFFTDIYSSSSMDNTITAAIKKNEQSLQILSKSSVQSEFGTLYIQTEPSDAEVFIDSKACGQTPVTIKQVEAGTRHLLIRKDNFKSIEKNITIPVDQLTKIALEMKIDKGSLNIFSNPSGADVWLNDQRIKEKTPIVIENLDDGKYNVRLELFNYDPYEKGISIISRKATEINADMVRNETYFKNFIGMEFVYVNPGCFSMGEMKEQKHTDGESINTVQIKKGYYLQSTLVTQFQWEKIMGDNPAYFDYDSACPVENVSWHDVHEFILKINKQDNRVRYRLPTEAEWEFAAKERDGSYLYSGGNEINQVAWYEKNSWGKSHPVGQKKSNNLGLFDMTGNLWEWCSDIYFDGLIESVEDKDAISEDTDRVIRGGSWDDDLKSCELISRDFVGPEYKDNFVGFRLAAELI